MRVIVNGDTSNPSVISYGHGNRTRYHGIEIGREVLALPFSASRPAAGGCVWAD